VEDREILDCIQGLVAEKHRLRSQRETSGSGGDVDLSRLQQLEDSLTQMWDLLRRRRALRAEGIDPDKDADTAVSSPYRTGTAADLRTALQV
jgi:hypothetical protein